MSLNAVLVGPQLRHFKNALVCLSKLGSELLVEALPEKLILRTINSSKSAYAAVTFYAHFFHTYDMFETRLIQAGILMKQALAVFRTQKIAKLVIEIAADAARLIATIYSDNGLVKEYKIPCMESEILQAAVDRSMLPTCVVAAAKELNRLLASFQSNLDEMTIIAMPDSDMEGAMSSKSVQLHSFLDPAKAGTEKSLHTQLCVDTLEVFLSYQHASDTASDVTFNLKDFRCMLGFCQEMQADVTIRFDRPGQPLLVEPHFRAAAPQEVDFGAELVLATLLESQAANLAGRGADVAPASTIVRRRPVGPPDGTSPNVPGDTPWGRPGLATAAPGTSRFAPQTNGATNHRLAPDFPSVRGGGDTGARGLDPPASAPGVPAARGSPEVEDGRRRESGVTAQRLADQFANAWPGENHDAEQGAGRGGELNVDMEDVDVDVEDGAGPPLLSGLNDNPQSLDAGTTQEPRDNEWENDAPMEEEAGGRRDEWGEPPLPHGAHWADAAADDEAVVLGDAAFGARWALPLHSRYLGRGSRPAAGDGDGEEEEEEEDAIPGTPPMG